MKVAASPQIYIGDALKWYSSHQSLVTSHLSRLIPSHLSLLSNFRVQGYPRRGAPLTAGERGEQVLWVLWVQRVQQGRYGA